MKILVCLVCLCGFAYGQNLRYDGIATGPKGPIPFAQVAVCTQPATTSSQPCTPLANLCSSTADTTCSQPNPVVTDSLGNFHVYVKVGQTPFTVQIYGTQVISPFILADQQGSSNLVNSCTVNGVSYVGTACAAFWGASDLGAQINAAYAAGPAAGVHIGVIPGAYSYTTPIVFGTNTKPAILDCSAGQQGISLPPVTGVTSLTYTPTTGIAVNFNGGGVGSGMRGCTLQGSGSGNATVGLQLSNSSGGNATNNLYESNDISNFGTGLLFGQNTFLNNFINNDIHDNGTQLSVPSTSSGAQENTSFFGGSFYTKTNPFSVTCVNVLANWDANFYGVSFDQCGITLNATGVRFQMHGGHMEDPNAVTSNQFITIGSSCTQCFTDLFGVTIQEDGNGAGRTSFISNGASGSHLLVQGGFLVVGAESPIAAFVATVSGSTTTLTDLSTNGSVFTALISGAGAFSAQTGSQFQTNVSPIIFTNTTISFGSGAPGGSCIGNTGIYLRNDAASASTVLYVCQAATWTAITAP